MDGEDLRVMTKSWELFYSDDDGEFFCWKIFLLIPVKMRIKRQVFKRQPQEWSICDEEEVKIKNHRKKAPKKVFLSALNKGKSENIINEVSKF